MSDVTEGAQQTDAGAAGGTPTGTQATGERRFTQDEVNTFLADERRKFKVAQDEAAAKAKRAADEKAAADRGEWEKVATERASERDRVSADLTSATAEIEALRAEIEAEIRPRLKALPEELRDLVPADGTPAQRLAAVRKLEAAALKLAGGTAPRGTLPGPRGTQATAHTATDADILAQKRARVGGL